MNRFLDTISDAFTSGENKNIIVITESDRKKLLTSIRRKIVKNEKLKSITHIQDNTIITDNENTNVIYILKPWPQNKITNIDSLFYYKPTEFKPHSYFITHVSYIPYTKKTKQYVVESEENLPLFSDFGYTHENLIP